jgi:hypothetical protein
LRVPDLQGQELTDFWEKYSQFEGRVKASFLAAATDKKSAQTIADSAINMADMLEALPGNDRRRFLDEYRNIIRFDDTMAQAKASGGVRNVDRAGKVKRFNIDGDQVRAGDNPLAFLLNRISIQHDALRPKRFNLPQEFEDFIGKNIPTRAYAENAMGVSKHAENFLRGASVLVFDTETTGAATNLAGVRQVASSKFTLDASGLHSSDALDVRFATSGMQIGKVWEGDTATGKLVTLAEKFDKGLKKSNAFGDEFAEKLIPFLEGIINSDHIAGHNVEFDIRQTLMNLQKTAAYKNPKGSKGGLNITKLVDDAWAKVNSPGALIDTQDLLKGYIPDLGLAKELERSGRLGPYGMENVVLKTNLAELMISDMGEGAAKQFFTGAQHTADYDTRLTAHLMQYVAQGRLAAKDIDKTGLQGIIRAQTLKTHAVIPIAHITDIGELHPELFNKLAKGEYGADGFKIYNTNTGKRIHTRTNARIDDVRRKLTDPDDISYSLRSGVSYLEQEMWEGRQNPLTNLNPNAKIDDVVAGLGEWNRFAGIKTSYRGFLNRDQTINKLGLKPTEAEFTNMVNHMADLGNPFANLSAPERMITNALASAGSTSGSVRNLLGKTDIGTRRAAQLAGDLGVLHWAEQTTISSVRPGAQVDMPLPLLRYAEEEGILGSRFTQNLGEMQMLNISAFEADSGEKVVNLRYGFQGTEAADLAAHFQTLTPTTAIGDKTLADFGLETVEDIMNYAENIRTIGSEYGATVGYMDKTAGEIAHDVIAGTLGSTRDRGVPQVRVAYHSAEDGLIASGPAIGDRLMDTAERVGLRDKVGKATAQFSAVAGALEDDTVWKQARLAAMRGGATGSAAGDIINNVVEGNWDELYPMLKTKKAGIAALGVGAALGGYYMIKRRRERAAGMAPFEEMPIEAQSHRPPPMYPGTQESTMSPMATAGLVGAMDSQRTNHSIMGKEKYSALYGGAI